MLVLSEWTREALVSGVCKGNFSLAYAKIKATDYLVKGVLSEADLSYIDANAVEPVPLVPEETPTEEIEVPTEE